MPAQNLLLFSEDDVDLDTLLNQYEDEECEDHQQLEIFNHSGNSGELKISLTPLNPSHGFKSSVVLK